MAAIYKTHRISNGVKPSVKRLTKKPKKNEIIHCNIVVYTLKPSNNWTQEQLEADSKDAIKQAPKEPPTFVAPSLTG